MSDIGRWLDEKINVLSAPDTLKQSLLWSLSGGKLLRGRLTQCAAKAWGADDHTACVLGASVEAAHACSLVHDDLPAMDNDLLRRGKPTVHAKFGEATAILAGDALISLAYEWLAISGHPHASQMVTALGYAFGPSGMISGQYRDLFEPINTKAMLFRLHAEKTGRLFGLCLAIGMLCEHTEASQDMWEIGRLLGICYQCQDDFADFESDKSHVQVKTAPDFMSLEDLAAMQNDYTDKIFGYLKSHCPDPEAVMQHIDPITQVAYV